MTRCAPLTAAHIEDLALRAGDAGLRSKDLAAALPGHSPGSIYRAIDAALAKSYIACEKRHPIAVYFHHSIDPATRQASFAQQLPQHRSERAEAVRAGTKAGMQARRTGLVSSPPQRIAKPPPRAVDPNALLPTATESYPEGFQQPECVRFLTRFERMLTEKAPPLPLEPISTWAQAVIQTRRFESAP